VTEPVNKLFIRTFGCQMNVNDSQRMEEVLRARGYQLTSQPEQAQVILINTCTVREKSRTKALSALGRYARLKQDRPDLVLGLAGCVAQQDGRRLLAEAPALDLVLGPDFISRLPQLVEEARSKRTVMVGFEEVEQYQFLQASPTPGQGSPTALVTIQKGCDNGCGYCIVPTVRGPEVSRPAAEVVEEIEALVRAGTREVTLIGQNVNSYGGITGKPGDFIGLLEQADAVDGLQRVRFTTSNPKDFSPDLARCFGRLKRLCPWLHLPVQSGSTPVLQRMKRGYTRQQYLDCIDQVRGHCPDISLGTDIIVGYPGETENDFLETVSLIEQIQYDYIYSFMYCIRNKTAAAELVDDVDQGSKARRLHFLQQRQDQITGQRLERLRGRVVDVLVEGPSRRGPPQFCGRDPGNHVVNFTRQGPAPVPGALLQVAINTCGRHSLTGEVVHDAEDPIDGRDHDPRLQ